MENMMPARLALLFLALATGCALAYRIIGSSVDPDGILREPFALIPLGWLFLALAAGCGLLHLVRSGARSRAIRRP
jgi:hypothetical protein